MLERLFEIKDKSYEECKEILKISSEKIFFVTCLSDQEIQYLRILDDSIIKLIYDADGINILFNTYEPNRCFEILYAICKFGEDFQFHLLNLDEVIDYILIHTSGLEHLLSLLSNDAYNYLQKIITYKEMCIEALNLDDSLFLLREKSYATICELIKSNSADSSLELSFELREIFQKLINIDTYRKLEESLKYHNDQLKLIANRRKYYDYVIDSFDSNTKLICIYEDFFDKYYYSSDLSLVSACKLDPFTSILKNTLFDNKDYMILDEFKNNKDKEGLLEILMGKSVDYLVECIIDYHLMDTYHNVCLEINQLLSYNNDANIISHENKLLYLNILSIYNMSMDDLFIFHNSLKGINVPQILYSDIRNSKNKAYSNILSTVKTKGNFNKNDVLTSKYGVDTYYLNGEPFVALVKCINMLVTGVLDNGLDISERTDAASFSLISDENLYTIYNPLVNYTFLYSDFSIDNIVHMFYSDSFSHYTHESNSLGKCCTRFLNVYNNASEFLNKCGEYNEIVIAQNNITTNSYDFFKPSPKLSSILCYDEPTAEMIATAKNFNISLTIVNRVKYNLNHTTRHCINKYDPNSPFCYSSDDYRKPYIKQ